MTHDELLIYRLIHCNWSASELLICRDGTVWRERNFGAHCLNALKNEVHKAEEHDAQHANQRENKPSQVQKQPKTASSTASKELPPWLQKRPRQRDEKIQDAVASDQNAGLLQTSPEVSIQQVLHSQIHGCSEFKSNSTEIAQYDTQLVQNENQVQAAEGSAACILETWEDAAESDASTAVPEGIDERDEVGVLVQTHSMSMNALLDKPSTTAAGCKNGKHSRFRKDLVNLNKAVERLRRREDNREVTHEEVLEFIRNSRVAQQLRELHGHDFHEDQFVQDALMHAKKS